ncbi:isoamylase early set domain-containing protein [bacterium]|nr:isoamylase early set domain-containing protein [bacterium]
MSIKKQYLKTKPISKVTFQLDGKFDSKMKTVHLVGDFNNWNPKKNPMKKLKDGSFKIILDLKTGQEYQFRYLVNSENWVNDNAADRYTPNPFGNADNCVVVV